jgi:hypothetical protein
MGAMAINCYEATRYVLPLREGGSLPAIIDTDEPGQYVVKFHGAGQGPRALVAEVIAAGLAGLAGLPVPKTAIVSLAEGFGMSEPDPEIQDLLRFSVGLNFGIRYLPGAIGFDPAADRRRVEPELASSIVWFDALITNVDRTPRNPNLLIWEDRVWLIDHGASLYFHHASGDWASRSQYRFPLIKDHVLLRRAADLRAAHERLRPVLTREALVDVVEGVPDEWLGEGAEEQRHAYVDYLTARLNGELAWLEEAESARRG